MWTGLTGGRGQKARKEHTYAAKSPASLLSIIKPDPSNPSSDHHGGPASWVLFAAISFHYTLTQRPKHTGKEKKKRTWANFVSRKLLRCALRRIFKRLAFYDVRGSRGCTDITEEAGRFPRWWAIRYFLKGTGQVCYLPSLIKAQLAQNSEEFLKYARGLAEEIEKKVTKLPRWKQNRIIHSRKQRL